MSYAIFRALGKQFRAEKGKTLKLPLMVAGAGRQDHLRRGAPLVGRHDHHRRRAAGEGRQGDGRGRRSRQDKKLYVFKFKRRKNYRRKTGHRQKHTEVRITDVKVG